MREGSLAEGPDTDLWKDSDGWSRVYKFCAVFWFSCEFLDKKCHAVDKEL